MARQVGTRVEVTAGSFRREPAKVVKVENPFIVVALDRDPTCCVAVLHEDVVFVDEREARVLALAAA
jgi:hypothetical protein